MIVSSTRQPDSEGRPDQARPGEPGRSSAYPVDLIVVGAGIIGLAHAVEAQLRGMSVIVVERDAHAVGASVRNFGHICTTAQNGDALSYALAARERWLELGNKAGVPIRKCGTLVVARSDAEMGVLEEFRASRGADQVTLLDRPGVTDRLGRLDPAVLGGAHLPLDLRTDPRQAVAAIADWLIEQGVGIHWRTSALGIEAGELRTSRGSFYGHRIVVAVGHDVDYLFPDIADSIELRRCALQMLRVAAPAGVRVDAAVLTGLSMLRYPGLATNGSATAVREDYARRSPELLAAVMNLMFTQRDDGDLIIGDTHAYALTHDPFDAEPTAELVLRELARLLDVPGLTVRERWRGTYASSARTDFLIARPDERIRVVAVTTGIGMTTSHGLAAAVLDDL